VPKIVQQPEL